MASAGPKYPTGNGALTTVAGTVGSSTNIATGLNAVGTEAQWTTVTKNTDAYVQTGAITFTGAEIPADAQITAVSVEVNHWATSGGAQYITLVLGATAAANQALTARTAATTDTVDFVALRPGGGSWQPADFTGGTLAARLRGLQPNNTTSRTYSGDFVRVTVTYDVPVPAVFALMAPPIPAATLD